MTTVRKVLIADSSDVLRRSLVRILRGGGMEVIEAPDGGKALSEALLRKPDLLLLDLSLPLLPIARLVGILRANPTTRSIPILFVGEPGQTVPETGDGGAEVIRRPFRGEDVLERVHRMLPPVSGGGTGGSRLLETGVNFY